MYGIKSIFLNRFLIFMNKESIIETLKGILFIGVVTGLGAYALHHWQSDKYKETYSELELIACRSGTEQAVSRAIDIEKDNFMNSHNKLSYWSKIGTQLAAQRYVHEYAADPWQKEHY
jgi:hypothetical protein